MDGGLGCVGILDIGLCAEWVSGGFESEFFAWLFGGVGWIFLEMVVADCFLGWV